jgi:uncharacterized tellurite resistance protein B-like protein
MDITAFKNIMFQTGFLCMTCDGDIDDREVADLLSICEKLPLFDNFDFQTEVNILIRKLNEQGKIFQKSYFDLLKKCSLTEDEELSLIDIAIRIIKADEIIKYPEIKFFKNIRHRLKVSNDKIAEQFPDFEQYLEEDIATESLLDIITSQYFDIADLPQFGDISIDTSLLGTKEAE